MHVRSYSFKDRQPQHNSIACATGLEYIKTRTLYNRYLHLHLVSFVSFRHHMKNGLATRLIHNLMKTLDKSKSQRSHLEPSAWNPYSHISAALVQSIPRQVCTYFFKRSEDFARDFESQTPHTRLHNFGLRALEWPLRSDLEGAGLIFAGIQCWCWLLNYG